MRARTGKIARLPLAIREELNRRLLENEPAKKICAWLNELPEAIAVCDEFGEQPIDAGNVSEWRKGGYADWLARRERIEETREMAQWSVKLAKASGGNISEGASAILAGQLLEVLEGISDLKSQVVKDGDAEKTEERMLAISKVVDEVSKALANVRKGDHSREKLDLERARLGQTGEALALEQKKFQRQTCDLFLKWYESEQAKQVAAAPVSNGEKIEKLGKLMFGEDW